MEATDKRTVSRLDPGHMSALAHSFLTSLESANKSPRTITTYLDAVQRLARFLDDTGMPSVVANIKREHVEAFMVAELKRTSPTSASIRYRALQQFFKWCAAEGEIDVSPMVNMSPPKVPEDPPPVISADALRALLKACEGTRFEDRRDVAIVRLFLDTGMRRAELANSPNDAKYSPRFIARRLGSPRRRSTTSPAPTLRTIPRRTNRALDPGP